MTIVFILEVEKILNECDHKSSRYAERDDTERLSVPSFGVAAILRPALRVQPVEAVANALLRVIEPTIKIRVVGQWWRDLGELLQCGLIKLLYAAEISLDVAPSRHTPNEKKISESPLGARLIWSERV